MHAPSGAVTLRRRLCEPVIATQELGKLSTPRSAAARWPRRAPRSTEEGDTPRCRATNTKGSRTWHTAM